MSSHYPRRNISDAQDPVQKNRGLSLSETLHVDTRRTLSHPYDSAGARSNGNQRTWRDPLSQSCHNATPKTDDGTNGNRPRRQMYVRASSSRSMQPGPAKDCGEIRVKTNRHLPNSRESGRGKDELCFSEHRVRRPREFNRSSSNADLGERISSAVNYVDDEVKPRSNVSRSMYPPRSKSAVSGSSQ